MKNPYEDIINLPHHTSKTHPPMALSMRAAQFSPFAALTGYGEAIKESGRETERRIILDEDRKTELDITLQNMLHTLPAKAEITYFISDKTKDGGRYSSEICTVTGINQEQNELITSDCRININNIIEIIFPITD